MSGVQVSLTVPDVEACIADLERRAREAATTAEQCREAAATLRKLYQVSTLLPSAPATRPAQPTAEVKPTRPREESPAPAPASERGNDSRVLAVLRAAAGPLRIGLIHRQLRASMAIERVRAHLADLVAEGLVHKSGVKSSTVYSLQKPMAPAAPARPSAAAAPAPSGGSATDLRSKDLLRANVIAWLMAGPFATTDTRHHVGDLIIALKDAGQPCEYNFIAGVLGDLVREKHIGILSVGIQRFYQRRPAA